MSVSPTDTHRHQHATTAEAVGVAWWNGLDRGSRRYRLDVVGSARPMAAFRAYQRRADEKPLQCSGMEGASDVRPYP